MRVETVMAVVGPTGSGKTAFSLDLARAQGGEVVNADSRQVYREMDIGTGKPSAQHRTMVPHHVYDIVRPDDEFSLALYLVRAREAIAGIHERGRPAILVGGTGQYVWALLEGWQVPSVPPDVELREALRERARTHGPESLHEELRLLDPTAAKRIPPTNVRRVVRALEVTGAAGVPFSLLQSKQAPPWRIIVLGLTMPREALYRRINERVEAMVAARWAEEVRGLLGHGYSPELPSFASLGYREMVAHVRGEATLEETVERIQRATRRFARRQYAWFRLNDPRIHWLDASSPPLAEAVRLCAAGEEAPSFQC